jgi:hypothetical protein
MRAIDLVFTLGNVVVLPFWALMILAPGWQMSRRVMASFIPVLLVPACYLVGMAASLSAGGVDLSKLTPDASGLAVLLGTPAGAAVAWLHMLALDLFAGRWAYLDSRERGIPAALASVALLFIFLAGPFGLLLYLGIRRFASKS